MITGASTNWAPGFALFALGYSCITTQLVLLREAMAAFSGNELVLGIVLGGWLLLMGIGSSLGRWSERIAAPAQALAVLQILLALIAPVQVLLLRALRNVVFVRGAEVGIMETALAIGLLLLPYCLLAGFALALGCLLLTKERGIAGVGTGYVLDSVGTVFGGLLFSLVFVRWFDHVRVLVFPAGLNVVSAVALGFYSGRRKLTITASGAGFAAMLFMTSFDLDRVSTRLEHPGERILARANSPYGRLVVTEMGGQINFLENGVALTTSRDDQHVEETVHYALCQRPKARRVLLVSGGISGTALEALRYEFSAVDYVELDPLLLELGRQFVPQKLAGQRLQVVNTDGRVHLKQAGAAQYDIIIVDLPGPSTAQLNRFYTAEFMAEAKHALGPDGVLSFALGTYENYVSPELSQLLSCGRKTLQGVFTNSLLLPGGSVFFLASDGALDWDIASRVEACGLKNKVVNRHYLDAVLTADRVAQVRDSSSLPSPVNRDMSPVLYYLHLRHWLSQFSFKAGLFAIFFAICLGVYLLRLRGNRLVVFASGFAGCSLELVLLLGFQVLCGSVYHQVGLIVTGFMAGLALGAWRANRAAPQGARRAGKNTLAWLALALALYSLALPFLLQAMTLWRAGLAALLGAKMSICGLTALLGALIGAQFPVANRKEVGGPGIVLSRLYTADFLGAFLGASVAGVILIPVIGVAGVCLLTAALNAIAALAVWVRPSTC